MSGGSRSTMANESAWSERNPLHREQVAAGADRRARASPSATHEPGLVQLA